MPNSDGVGFVRMELESTLRGPDGKATADRLIARLDQLAQEIEAYKSTGLSSADYSRVEIIDKALAAARGIVLGIQPNNQTKDIYS